MSWYLKVLKKYAEFDGRARRKEFWMFVLFNAVFTALAAVFDNVFNTKITGYSHGVFETLYLIGVFIPSLAVTVRRLHDIGKSGWMILIVLIPIIGVIWMLVLMASAGEPGENQYGPNPKEVDAQIMRTGSSASY